MFRGVTGQYLVTLKASLRPLLVLFPEALGHWRAQDLKTLQDATSNADTHRYTIHIRAFARWLYGRGTVILFHDLSALARRLELKDFAAVGVLAAVPEGLSGRGATVLGAPCRAPWPLLGIHISRAAAHCPPVCRRFRWPVLYLSLIHI